MGTETLQALSDFSKILLPSLATAASMSGAITSASAKYAATALFMDVLITASIKIVMPLIYAYLAAVLADAAAGGEMLRACAKLIKGICTGALTALVIIFTTYLSITGVITGSADAVTTRLAKTTISAALPVVGGIISDAAGTLVAGASVLRNAVGIFGMLAIIAACITCPDPGRSVPSLQSGGRPGVVYDRQPPFRTHRRHWLGFRHGPLPCGRRYHNAFHIDNIKRQGGDGALMEAIRNWIIGIAGAAVLTGIALAITPRGRVYSVLKLVCGIVMALALIKPLMNLDFEAYSRSLAGYREQADAIGSEAGETQDRLSRTIIEEEYAAYILDKAQLYNIEAFTVKVNVKWGDEGWWYPYEAYLDMTGPEDSKKSLMRIIESDLGIPAERQYWS
jgi:hypothetical protein